LLVVEVVDMLALVAICLVVLVAESTQEPQVLLPGKVTTAVLAVEQVLIQEAVEVALEPLALMVAPPEQVLAVLVYPTLLLELPQIMLVVVERQVAHLQPLGVQELVEPALHLVLAEQDRQTGAVAAVLGVM
jgi:hypothetical protein